MRERPDFLDNSLIVAAHPDDEVLWFGSILRGVDEVLVVFGDYWATPDLGEARRNALADFPRQIECLGLDEAGAYGCADWRSPSPDPHGLAFGYEATLREIKRMTKRALPRIGPIARLPISNESVSRLYQANSERIAQALRPRLAPDMNVFTHNPWGEYGHEEHVQLFRVLARLREEIGFRLWISNYCTERSLTLAMRYFTARPGSYLRLPNDTTFADEVAAVYRRHGCWTWSEDWAWFEEECFMEAPRDIPTPAAAHRHLFPLNLFTIDDERVARRSASAAL